MWDSYKNSIFFSKFIRSYYNLKNNNKFLFYKKLLRKKFGFRLKKFFLFFELRITNILIKLGFNKLFFFKKYNKFIIFKKYNKFIILCKNINYIVKVNDLIVMQWKFYYINRFYNFYLNSFLEVNKNIKSFYVVRLPHISEIIKN